MVYAVPTELVPGVEVLALRTPTLPPATHTNATLLGTSRAVLVEPASPDDAEIARVVGWLETKRAAGVHVEALALTHHHVDHAGGALRLREKLGLPLLGHPATVDRLRGLVPFDGTLDEGATLDVGGGQTINVLHTPGHAPGHLCFHDVNSGTMIVGDMVASVGTILIEPHDGHMATYLDSLKRLHTLAPSRAVPAHGEVIDAPAAVFERYLKHRVEREARVLAALRTRVTVSTAIELVPIAYAELPRAMWELAALSTEAHLVKLTEDGLARGTADGWVAA